MQRRGFVMAGLAHGLAGYGSALRAAASLRVTPKEGPHGITVRKSPIRRDDCDDAAHPDDVQRAVAAFAHVVIPAGAGHAARASRRMPDGVALRDVPTDDLRANGSGPGMARNRQRLRGVRPVRLNGRCRRQECRLDRRNTPRMVEPLALPHSPMPVQGGVKRDGRCPLIADEGNGLSDMRDRGTTYGLRAA